MVVDMSYRLGWIDSSSVKQVNDILLRAKLPIAPPKTMTVEMFKSVGAPKTPAGTLGAAAPTCTPQQRPHAALVAPHSSRASTVTKPAKKGEHKRNK
ncbi:hypothetical protein GOBAR_DD18946 [Gossypium barbadense]|nr:hypothetical protein GOBAR_DD18946 [Gossypium barbadense]